jgi:hypothetical protein
MVTPALVEKLEHSSAYNIFIGDVIATNQDPKETAILTQTISSVVRNTIPNKKKNKETSGISCSTGEITFKPSMCDIRSTINLMPLSIFKKLEKVEMKPSNID